MIFYLASLASCSRLGLALSTAFKAASASTIKLVRLENSQIRGNTLESKQVQSAKILLLPPKYEIIMVPSNYSNFQYCDSNIGLFSIAPL